MNERRRVKTKPRACNTFVRDDRGISNLIGALMLITILVSVFATIEFSFVPVWTEEAEADHAGVVTAQFRTIKGDIDQQATNGSITKVSNLVTLRRDNPSVFAQEPLPGPLRFDAGQRDVVFHAAKLTYLEQNGTLVAAQGTTGWTAIPTTATLSSVSKMVDLKIKIDSIADTDNGDGFEVNITDANNAFAGRIRVEAIDRATGFDVRVIVVDAAVATVYDQVISSAMQATAAPYYFNALDPEYGFGALIGAAKGPVSIGFTESGLTGEYRATYHKTNTAGETLLTSTGGKLSTGVTNTYDGGVLRFDSVVQFFSKQTFLLENGGFILSQNQGSVFKDEPVFNVAKVGNVTRVSVVVPSLSGSASAVQGPTSVSVSSTLSARTAFSALAPSFNLNVSTEHPALWKTAWTDAFADASVATTEYSIVTGADYANITVLGTNAAVASSYNDLALEFVHATITTKIEV